MLVIMQFPIDLEQYDRREQLKKSGLGKVRLHLPNILRRKPFGSYKLIILDSFVLL